MKHQLLKLFKQLSKLQLTKEAEEVDELFEDEDYEEPWHQDAVEEFGAVPISEEEYLKQTFPVSERHLKSPTTSYEERQDLKEICDREGFKLLETGEKGVIAGKGGFGSVLRGVYQGKPAVAKIIINRPEESEVKNWETILEAANTTVPELKPYVPKIYKLKTDYLQIPGEDDVLYSIVIMEELYPLNKQMQEALLIKHSPINLDVIKDPDFLWDLSVKLEAYAQSLFPEKISANEIFQVLYKINFSNLEFLNLREVPRYLAMPINNFLRKKFPYKEQSRSTQKLALYHFEVDPQLKKLISEYLDQELPFNYAERDKGTYFAHLPETRGFLHALKLLAEKANLRWSDLVAPKNVMQDRDGNLKIIDVGIYSRKKEIANPWRLSAG